MLRLEQMYGVVNTVPNDGLNFAQFLWLALAIKQACALAMPAEIAQGAATLALRRAANQRSTDISSLVRPIGS